MGSAAAIGAMLVSPIAGRISDWCNRKMKPVYLLLYGVFTVAMTFFCLMTTDIIPNWRPGVYISCIITIAAINTVTPVLYELAVDITFPVLESTSCGVLVLGNNVFCLIFLLGGENANPEAHFHLHAFLIVSGTQLGCCGNWSCGLCSDAVSQKAISSEAS